MKYVVPKSKKVIVNLVAIFCLFIVGCDDSEPKDNTDFSNCKYGSPKAIFNEEIPKITAHSFNIFKKEGIELVRFDNGMVMELIQSGCDHIVQSFKFRIPGDHRKKNALDWVEEAVVQLRFLGGLDPKFASLAFWGNEIEQIKSEIKLGSTHDIQQGFKVKIDKVLSTNESILLLELSQ